VTQAANTTESYTYDPVGNRLSSLNLSPYVNNTSNELTSTPNASYTFDYNGNTTSKAVSAGTTNYTWDYENRLASVTLPGTGGSITFKYDPLGRRIQKAFTQNSTTTTTNYLYDGSNAIADIDQNGNVLARYTETQNIDEPLAELRSGTTSYYEADGLGSVTSLSGSSGSLANTYTYDSFGNVTASTGTVTNRFQYTAREFDSESGLYYYRARYYDPNAGRFLSEDPIDFLGGVNFYRYVRNNPPKYRDPNGKDPVIGGIVGIIAGGIYGGLGARLACGSTRDVVVAVIVGAGLGGIVGAADPSFGVGTLAFVGGVAGGLGDVAGQLVASNGTSLNLGSTAGAIVGGAISGAVGSSLGSLGQVLGLPELPVTVGGASIGGGISASLSAAGAVAAKPSSCGCDK
jgi:RHS repeat-associated protein